MPSTSQKILALLLLIPIVIGSFILGLFFFAVALGVVVTLVAVMSLRMWWLRRKLRKAGAGSVLEGEFRILSARERNSNRRGEW